jgi:adenylate cyclase
VACGLCLLLALACSFGVILPRRVWQSVTAGIVVLVGAAGIAFYAYSWNWWYPLVFQTGAVALAFVVCLIFNYATEGRQKTFIKKAFRHYLSPDVIDMLLRHPEQLTLGGERRELTILFSDLKGFSAISEKLDPRALTRLLNDYLTDMTDIILAEGGTLDKYEGDAIMAFWNAPLTQTDHGRRACRAALRCQRRLAERRAEFEQRTGVGLYARTGLNTGEVVVGNMGSANRFDYTVLGDAANLASRLEGANKAFGTWNMVSETTWAQAREYFQGRLLGRIRVVGRAAPVCVYELLAEHDEPVELDISAFEEAVRRCVEGRARQALEQFRQWPDDPVAQRYIALIESLQGASWDGIWNLQQK